MTDSIGVIGLGAMGRIVASHLLARQFKVAGFDIDPAKTAALTERGLDARGSLGELSAAADILITSLPSAAALGEVVAGLAAAAAKPGQILIEASTLAIDDKQAAARALAESGRILLDAPISGTPPMLTSMSAITFVGGDRAAYDRCAPLFAAYTAKHDYVGAVGDASKVKFLANYLVYVHTVAAAECLTFAQKAGLDLGLVHGVLKTSAGASAMFSERGGSMVKSDYTYPDGSIFAAFAKDASIISEYAAQVNAPVHLFAAARQAFHSALALGLEDRELAAVCRAVEAAAGIERQEVFGPGSGPDRGPS